MNKTNFIIKENGIRFSNWKIENDIPNFSNIIFSSLQCRRSQNE